MRRHPTRSEHRFFKALCVYFDIKYPRYPNQYKKLPFRLQKQFHFKGRNNAKGYIADFYLKEHKIVFEVDGDNHQSIHAQQYDSNREYMMLKRGVKTYRITNKQTLDCDYMFKFINDALNGKLEYKPKAAPKLKLSRQTEIELQNEYIKKYGVTKCRTITR